MINSDYPEDKAYGSKSYSKSLTVLMSVLKMINENETLTEIARTLHMSRPHVSYYVRKAKENGYLKESLCDRIKIIELTQLGTNFLDQYSKTKNAPLTICRTENVRLIAPVHRPPTRTPDWSRVEVNNWAQYRGAVDDIRVHYNDSKNPSIEFLPSPIDGDDPWQLCGRLYHECSEAAEKLEQLLDMGIGGLRFESGVEWVIYDPIAKAVCKHNGQVTSDGLWKINASKPRRRGEVEYFDPRRAAEYFAMPGRLTRLEKLLEEQNDYIKKILPLIIATWTILIRIIS